MSSSPGFKWMCATALSFPRILGIQIQLKTGLLYEVGKRGERCSSVGLYFFLNIFLFKNGTEIPATVVNLKIQLLKNY